MQCTESAPEADQSPCNWFVGKALQEVWKLDDFKSSPGYLTANEISTYLLTHCPPWKSLGTAADQSVLKNSQQAANDSMPVVAVRPDTPNGHVALIIPGKLEHSTTWNLEVPNSASFIWKKPADSYVGRRLSEAFRNDYKPDVKIYTRLV